MGRTGDYQYRKRRAQMLAKSDTCWLCGKWMDPDIKWPDPMSPSADHVSPVGLGGDNLGPLKPAHLRRNRMRSTKDPETARPQLPTSREW